VRDLALGKEPLRSWRWRSGSTRLSATSADVDEQQRAEAIQHTRADMRRVRQAARWIRPFGGLRRSWPRGAESPLVFGAVCEETGRLLGATSVNLAHFTADGFNLTMAGWSLRGVHVPTGSRLSLDGDSINTLVRDTAAPSRFDNYDGARGELAAVLRRLGIRSEVGAPVMVEGRVWGALIAGADEHEPLPGDAEHRLARFAHLIGTAISNATVRADLVACRARIVDAADEQPTLPLSREGAARPPLRWPTYPWGSPA
jgi:hypothetical protein